MERDDNGKWVAFDDYEALRAITAKLAEAAENLSIALNAINDDDAMLVEFNRTASAGILHPAFASVCTALAECRSACP